MDNNIIKIDEEGLKNDLKGVIRKTIEETLNTMREIRRRTRVVGCFPDGESALMLVCARLRYVASKDWGTKRYLNMKHLYELENQREIETKLKKARKNLA